MPTGLPSGSVMPGPAKVQAIIATPARIRMVAKARSRSGVSHGASRKKAADNGYLAGQRITGGSARIGGRRLEGG